MVAMTRLNGHMLLINADLIKLVEATPDTTLTLVTGEKLVVLERCEEVLEYTRAWRASLLRAAWPTADAALLSSAANRTAADHHEENL